MLYRIIYMLFLFRTILNFGLDTAVTAEVNIIRFHLVETSCYYNEEGVY